MKALVLAAGKSTRISSVAGDAPKPLLKLNGVPVLVYNLKLLKAHGVKHAWINLHYQGSLIKDEIGDGGKWGIGVQYSEEKELLGTAGAVKKLEKEFKDGTFFVLYGDNLTNCDLTSLVIEHKKSKALGTVVVFDRKKTLNTGIAGGTVELEGDGMIRRFVEGRSDDPAAALHAELVNSGIYAFEPAILDHIPKGNSDFGKDVFPALLSKGLKLYAFRMEGGYCLGIDTPETYLRAQEAVSRKQ